MYDYFELLKDQKLLQDLGYRVEDIGTTVFGRKIPSFMRGEGCKILILGATHAREHVTAKLVVDLAKNYEGREIGFIPMLNPDGVQLISQGLSSVPTNYREIVQSIQPDLDFRLWKANGRGVDINVNYDADWGRGRENLFLPSPSSFVGEYPHSEKETKASVDFVLKYGVKILLSYHAKGEVIYWDYGGEGNKKLAKKLSKTTGYALSRAKGSVGGFKDWFILKGLGSAFTVEVGKDSYSHPYPYSDYENIFAQNQKVCEVLENYYDYG